MIGRERIKADQLAQSITKALSEYSDAVFEDTYAAGRESAQMVVKEIKNTAPVGRRKKYAKSWRSKETYKDSRKFNIVCHSPTQYGLAHLLEHGHAKRGGGRTRAFPHIAPAETKGVENFEKKVAEAIGKGG